MSTHEYGYLGRGRRMDMRIRNKEEKNKNKTSEVTCSRLVMIP